MSIIRLAEAGLPGSYTLYNISREGSISRVREHIEASINQSFVALEIRVFGRSDQCGMTVNFYTGGRENTFTLLTPDFNY